MALVALPVRMHLMVGRASGDGGHSELVRAVCHSNDALRKASNEAPSSVCSSESHRRARVGEQCEPCSTGPLHNSRVFED